ncbi:transposase family protein [Verrucomicrobium sp. 3C]|uniref:transposase family protein n=1 Tax=Verrucomicrobium sp. 3C TaxID=1134055 RepID=UPI0003A8EEE8|nr:transposase family protein [Verrucomicrobium sp. 3C]
MKQLFHLRADGARDCGLEVSIASSPEEIEWFDGQLKERHYLGAGRSVGDYLRQVIAQDGQAVALLVWGPACYALKDRDRWIGWSAVQRVERLKLIVQNRRFSAACCLLPRGRRPNLASQAFGSGLAGVAGAVAGSFWLHSAFGRELHRSAGAYTGTCYKASNWEGAVGYSAGYSRHPGRFFTLPNDRPKRLWLRPLSAQARQTLRAAQLPEECRAGLSARPSGTLPVNAQQLESLLEVFWKAPDPRKKNAHYPVGSVLTLIAMALLAGRREIAEIARFATSLTQPQRRRLGLPLKKGTGGFHPVPGYSVFYQVLTRMDPEAFASRLTDWLQAHSGLLPQALAMDGKMIRHHIGLLTLAQQEDGAPQAVAVHDHKAGQDTPRCEQSAAVALLEKLPALDGKIITARPVALSARRQARLIVEKRGRLPVRDQGKSAPRLLQEAQALDALPDTPLFARQPNRSWPGRNPRAPCLPPIEPLVVDFPFARALIVGAQPGARRKRMV